MKTLAELRAEFENMAMSSKFIIDRNKHGEYPAKATYFLWAGYWECAVKNKILVGAEANFRNMHT